MLESIEEAAKNFCIHQLNTSFKIKDGITHKRTLIAYIDIETQENKKYRVYIASDINFMQRVAKLFLEEDESDEETLKDMTLETANLIIGSAKVLAEENEDAYVIKTPHFEKIDNFSYPYDEAKTIVIDDDQLTLAVKELDDK